MSRIRHGFYNFYDYDVIIKRREENIKRGILVC